MFSKCYGAVMGACVAVGQFAARAAEVVRENGAKLAVAATLAVGGAAVSSASATTPPAATIPDIGVDVGGYVTEMGTNLGTIAGYVIGVAIALLLVWLGFGYLSNLKKARG